jgi:DNA-binding beta-propeller fold protein YncE
MIAKALTLIALAVTLGGCAAAPRCDPVSVTPVADTLRRLGSIAIFEPGAVGDVAPERVLFGPGNGLYNPATLAVDRQGYLYVANYLGRGNTVWVFTPDADGEAAACRAIGGPRTGIQSPSGLAVDDRDQLYVGSHGGSSMSPQNGVTVFDAGVSGDTAPRRSIGGGNRVDGGLLPYRLTLDSHDSLYVRSVSTLAVYSPGATGAVEPVRYIEPEQPTKRDPNRGFIVRRPPQQIFVLDRHDTLYAVSSKTVIAVYSPGYTGVEPPVRCLEGPRTGIHPGISDIALDDRGWLYVADRDSSLIKIFAPGADGDVPPARVIGGPRTRIRLPHEITVERSGRLYVANGGAWVGMGGMPNEDRRKVPDGPCHRGSEASDDANP